jgi:hypothetical protein
MQSHVFLIPIDLYYYSPLYSHLPRFFPNRHARGHTPARQAVTPLVLIPWYVNDHRCS